MSNYLYAGILVIVLLVAIGLNKSFNALPFKELKKRARTGDQPEKSIYRVSAYGASLHALLLSIIILSSAGSFILLSQSSSTWIAFLIIILVIWLAFIWLPSSPTSSLSKRSSRLFTPFLAWVLEHTHPVFNALSKLMTGKSQPEAHTGIYDEEDLIDLLGWQGSQGDNRIPKHQIEMAKAVLSFGKKKVSEILVPRREVIIVNEQDPISPVLIDELHKSGLNFFPVYSSKKDNIVGILFIGDLLDQATSSKIIRSLMDKNVTYIHEDYELEKVFRAFLKTHQHLFIVVNKFEEFVGVVSIENILSEILGEPILDEFDSFEDLRAVAASKAKVEHAEHIEEVSEAEEMVE